MYVIYIIDRGWLASAGTISDWTRAKQLTRDQAFTMCRTHRDPDGNPLYLPILRSHLLEVIDD